MEAASSAGIASVVVVEGKGRSAMREPHEYPRMAVLGALSFVAQRFSASTDPSLMRRDVFHH